MPKITVYVPGNVTAEQLGTLYNDVSKATGKPGVIAPEIELIVSVEPAPEPAADPGPIGTETPQRPGMADYRNEFAKFTHWGRTDR